MDDQQPQPQGGPNYPRRFITLVVVFGAWSAYGASNDWDGEDWAVVAATGVVATVLSLFLRTGWRVVTSTFTTMLVGVVALAAIQDARGVDEEEKEKPPPATVTETTPAVPEFQRSSAERLVRDWFDAKRKGDGTTLCLTQTEELSTGGCGDVKPQPSLPAGKELAFDSVEPLPGGGVEVRVHAEGVDATLELTGAGVLLRVARVEGLG